MAGAARNPIECPARERGLPPVLSPHCRVLVLGSFPGRASLAAGHYYAHPRNGFWPIVSAAIGEPLEALAFDARYARLLAHGVGLWDVIAACERRGSLDSNIRAAAPNDLEMLRELAPSLRRILFNGRAAAKFERVLRVAGYDVRVMPSTSPAHAAMRLEHKCLLWRAGLAGLIAADGMPERR